MLEAAAILARLDAIMSELAEFRAAVAGAEADDEKGTSNCLYPWRRPGGRAHAPSRCPGAAPPRRHAFGRRQREHALQVCKNLWRDLVISKGDGRSFGNIMCVPIEHDVHGVAARFKVQPRATISGSVHPRLRTERTARGPGGGQPRRGTGLLTPYPW